MFVLLEDTKAEGLETGLETLSAKELDRLLHRHHFRGERVAR